MTSVTGISGLQQETFMPQSANVLDPATADFLNEFSKTFASIANLSIPEQRAVIKKMFFTPESQLEPIRKIEDKVMFGRSGPIKVRLFSPKDEDHLPVIIYFHGGGWVYGSVEESETICRRLANETGSIVAAVEYRLSPEHKFPIPLEDCYDATQWIAENAPTFLGDPGKMILCGESAGGNLAAAVALMTLKTKQFAIAGQLLLYPVLTSDLEKKHYDNSPDKSLISYENMHFFWKMYLPSPEEGENPFASPLKSENFAGLPSSFIVTAEHDALKHEGAQYEEALQRAGVRVEAKNYLGVIHGFLDLPLADVIKKEAFGDIASWVSRL
jgi:acetyl esterase